MNERIVVYDTGVLIAIDSRVQAAVTRHDEFLHDGTRVVVPAVVAAKAVRNPARQARLMRTLRGCDVVPFTRDHYAAVGKLLAKAGTGDVVDAFVALTAVDRVAVTYTSDRGDIRHLVRTLGEDLPVYTA